MLRHLRALGLTIAALTGCRHQVPNFDPTSDRRMPDLAQAVAARFQVTVGEAAISRGGDVYLTVPDSAFRALPERQQRDSMDQIVAWAWTQAAKGRRVRSFVFCCAPGMHLDQSVERVYPSRPTRAAATP